MAGHPEHHTDSLRWSIRRVRAWVCAISALAALALTGCGGTHRKTATHTSARGGSTTSESSTAPEPIATADDTVPGQNGPSQFRVSIYDLRRDGPFLQLDFGVTCLSPSAGCQTDNAFAPGYQNATTTRYDSSTPAGVTLVDPPALKQYLAVRDSDGAPYTSEFTDGFNQPVSQTFLAWVRYPSPPASTTSLDVTFPNGGVVIPHVPITSGAGPTGGGQLQPAQPSQFAQGPDSTNTNGLTLPVENLSAISGNATGSDSESPGQAQITLHSDVLFQFNKSNLTPQAKSILSSVAQQVKSRAKGTVQVTGYTDSIGTDAVNIPLSQARAASVVAALKPLSPGINYTASGKGSADPVAPNANPDGSDNPAGRALNRRVTIVFAAAPTHPAPPAPPTGAAGTTSAAQSTTMTFTPVAGNISDKWQVSGSSLYRDGNLTVLNATIACIHSTESNGCDPSFELGGTATAPPLPLLVSGTASLSLPAAPSLNGFYLLDPASRAEDIPIEASNGTPLTSVLNTGFVSVGDSYRVWIYFPSLPSSISNLTLVSPDGSARISDVPISAAAP